MSSSGKIDPLTLDALVLGTDGPDDAHAWSSLVRIHDAAEQWQAAIERRQRIDHMASVIRGRQWLAKAILHTKRASRRWRQSGTTPIGLTIERGLFAPVLGDEKPGKSFDVSPGTIEVVEVRPGEIVSLNVPSGFDVRFRTDDTEGELPELKWQMEPDESPVLLFCTPRALEDSDDVDAPATAVILVESGKGEKKV